MRHARGVNQAGAEREHWVVRGNTKTAEIRRDKIIHARDTQANQVSKLGSLFMQTEHHQDPPTSHGTQHPEEEMSPEERGTATEVINLETNYEQVAADNPNVM